MQESLEKPVLLMGFFDAGKKRIAPIYKTIVCRHFAVNEVNLGYAGRHKTVVVQHFYR